MEDKYRKLRPWPETSAEERCDCKNVEGIYLAYKFCSNPINCLECDGEIAPESLSLSETAVDAIATWNAVFGSLFTLWIESGEYEEWAKEQLLSSTGQVNEQGLNICRNLLNPNLAYYLWFYTEPDTRPDRCPCCNIEFSLTSWNNRLACHACRIIV